MAAAVLRRYLLADGAHEDEQQEQQESFFITSDEEKQLRDGTGPVLESLQEAFLTLPFCTIYFIFFLLFFKIKL